jgi:hypothetical protein
MEHCELTIRFVVIERNTGNVTHLNERYGHGDDNMLIRSRWQFCQFDGMGDWGGVYMEKKCISVLEGMSLMMNVRIAQQ